MSIAASKISEAYQGGFDEGAKEAYAEGRKDEREEWREMEEEVNQVRTNIDFYRTFAAEVLAVKRLPTPYDMEAMCRRAYDNQYHKIKADMGYDQWRMVWLKAIAAHESDPQYSDGPLPERGWD